MTDSSKRAVATLAEIAKANVTKEPATNGLAAGSNSETATGNSRRAAVEASFYGEGNRRILKATARNCTFSASGKLAIGFTGVGASLVGSGGRVATPIDPIDAVGPFTTCATCSSSPTCYVRTGPRIAGDPSGEDTGSRPRNMGALVAEAIRASTRSSGGTFGRNRTTSAVSSVGCIAAVSSLGETRARDNPVKRFCSLCTTVGIIDPNAVHRTTVSSTSVVWPAGLADAAVGTRLF